EAYRRALHDDLAAWFESAATERPTVLAVEDLHWADEASLTLTAELAGLAGRVPLTLGVLWRPEGRPRIEAGPPGRQRVDRGQVGPTEVEELLAELLGDVAPELARTVHQRTEGNPFFVEELARALADGAETDALPPTVEGVLAARIDLLRAPAAGLLQTA